MEIKLLDSRQLRCLVILAEEMHFGRAALHLGIAQSALSGHIRRLEDNVGGLLFERGRKSAVKRTPLGEIVLAEARQALGRLEQAERIARAASRGEAGPARLHFVFSAALSGVLTLALKAVNARLPLLDVHAVPMETPQQILALANAQADVGFLRPQDHYPAGVSAKVVHREAMMVAHGIDHRLSNVPHLRCADLAGETFVIPQAAQSMGLTRLVGEVAKRGHFLPPKFVDCGDFMTAACMAAAGKMIVLAPRSLANLTLEGLRFREVEDFDGTVDLALAWREPAPPLAQIILDQLAVVSGQEGLGLPE